MLDQGKISQIIGSTYFDMKSGWVAKKFDLVHKNDTLGRVEEQWASGTWKAYVNDQNDDLKELGKYVSQNAAMTAVSDFLASKSEDKWQKLQ